MRRIWLVIIASLINFYNSAARIFAIIESVDSSVESVDSKQGMRILCRHNFEYNRLIKSPGIMRA